MQPALARGGSAQARTRLNMSSSSNRPFLAAASLARCFFSAATADATCAGAGERP
jgi:hypothetical protein